MDKLKSYFKKFRLTLLFALVVFIIMLFTMILLFLTIHLMIHFGIVPNEKVDKLPLFLFSIVSLGIGTVLSIIFSTKPLKPIREIMAATDRIADGDYSVRLSLKGPEEFRTLSDKFNHMAEELGSVEMLRTDFVGNFSHEFKTPIVSIRGFAKALKWDDLTKEERTEYLDIIINEAERLSELSLNVLYLSKIENQTIITNKRCYNISEQIRRVVALLDHKFSEKQLEVLFDSDEFMITANEEMMKQVWINLLDNGIKFSPIGGKIAIYINPQNDNLSVKISNQGEEIPPEMREHIFDKFYQGDSSHSTNGNGLGLAIVKKIIDLHNGRIIVHSSKNGSTFELLLKIN